MPLILCYQCRSELLPMVEAALAAQGYHVERTGLAQPTTTVLTYGTTTVLLSSSHTEAMAVIEIYGSTGLLAAQLLESLPMGIQKRPSVITLG